MPHDLADDKSERTTYQKCLDPDPAYNTLRMAWLKSRRPEVYGDKVGQSGLAEPEATTHREGKGGPALDAPPAEAGE